MTYTVTYRDRNGAKREEAIEAADRATCVAACRAHGISPIAIREGANGLKDVNGGVKGEGMAGVPRTLQSIPHSHSSIFSHFHNSTILAVLSLLAILGGAAWWWFGVRGAPALPGDGSPGTARPTKAMPKEVKPTVPKPAPKANDTIPETGMVEVYRAGEFVKVKREKGDGYVYFRDADGNLRRTNNKRIILALKPSVNQAEVDAKILEGPPQRPPRRYANATHRQLAQYVQPGKFAGPPDPISDKDALKACDEAIKYSDSDSDEVLDEKKSVEELAKELKEYLKKGGHANDYFSKLSQRQELEADAVAETRATVRRLCLQGKPEEAEAALNAFNKYLGEKGIPPVNMSGSIERARKRGRAVRPAAQ